MIEYEQIVNADKSGFKRNGITWLASWPKSGNTWVRLFLSAYLKGPDNFSMTTINLDGDSQVYWYQMHSPLPMKSLSDSDIWRIRPTALWSQFVLSRKSNLIMKSHNANVKINDYCLIPHELTHKVIYVVRDPRDVLVSWRRYAEVDWEQAWDVFSSETSSLQGKGGNVSSFISSWKKHVETWVDDEDLDLAMVTYEGLLSDPEAGFRNILDFLGIHVEDDRFFRCVELTDIRTLRKIEDETGFIDNGSGERFFHKGGSRWQEELPAEYADKIEDACGDLMERLGYLGENNGSNNGILHEREGGPVLRQAQL